MVKYWMQARKLTTLFFGHHCTMYIIEFLLLWVVWYSGEGPYVSIILCISGAWHNVWHTVSTYGVIPKIVTVWKEKNRRVAGENIKGKQRI